MPCSHLCEEAGLVLDRHNWQALEATVEGCVTECCLNGGSLTAGRLQAALCKAQVHTRKKAVKGWLGRYRKANKANDATMLAMGMDEMLAMLYDEVGSARDQTHTQALKKGALGGTAQRGETTQTHPQHG